MRSWGARHWLVAAGAAMVSVLVFGLPTALIPNPVFGRPIEAPAWGYPALVATAVLSGLLLATYVRAPAGATSGTQQEADTRRVTAGGLLAFFAIGCPTCNKLVVLALGTTGALTWFEPVQPLLALAGIVLLAVVLRRRLQSLSACAVPAARR